MEAASALYALGDLGLFYVWKQGLIVAQAAHELTAILLPQSGIVGMSRHNPAFRVP